MRPVRHVAGALARTERLSLGNSLLIAGVLLLGGARTAVAQSCPEGRDPRVWLGIGTFHCQGGTCIIGPVTATMQREKDRPPRPDDPPTGQLHLFSVEPRLWHIAEDGPAAGRLRDGDALVAVNGYPITTREGGRALSSIRPGVPVRLLVRRDGRSIETVVFPETTCRPAHVSAGPGPRPRWGPRWWRELKRPGDPRQGIASQAPREDPSREAGPRDVGPRAGAAPATKMRPLGLELLGATIVEVGNDGEIAWRFAEPPVVLTVAPGSAADRAGVPPGAVLLEADGRSLTTPAGTAALGRFGAGRSLRLRLRVAGEKRTVTVEARS